MNESIGLPSPSRRSCSVLGSRQKGIWRFSANLETAVNVFLDEPIHIGETVVIFGQGVVGLLLTQLARRNGAGGVDL